jgi:hypothetical protein
MKKKVHTCIGCGGKSYQDLVCGFCIRNKDVREELCIKTSSDYRLSSDDWFANAMSFLHACGVLNEFIDKVESDIAEIMMKTFNNSRVNLDSILTEKALLSYEEKNNYGRVNYLP